MSPVTATTTTTTEMYFASPVRPRFPRMVAPPIPSCKILLPCSTCRTWARTNLAAPLRSTRIAWARGERLPGGSSLCRATHRCDKKIDISHCTPVPVLYCAYDTPDRSSRIEWKTVTEAEPSAFHLNQEGTDKVVARLPPATWSDIVCGAHRLLHGLVLYEMLREPEIDELDAGYIAWRLHQPVLELKVAMHYSVSVHVSHLNNAQNNPYTNCYTREVP